MRRILILILVLFTACSKGKKGEFKPQGQAKVKRGSITMEVTATGAVKPQVGAQIKVGARISGKVERLFVQAGDRVKKGQLIAVIEHEDLKNQMLAKRHQMEAALARLQRVKRTYPLKIKAARESLEQAIAEHKLALKDLKRIRRLHGEGLVSDRDLDDAVRLEKVKRAEVEARRARLKELQEEFRQALKEAKQQYLSAKRAYQQAKVLYSYAFIYSPISGVVSSVSTQQGETVVAGLNAPTFITVVDLHRLQVDAYVDETDIGKVKPGQKATFVVDAYPDKVFKGVVETIYPGAIIRNNVVFYDVKIRIETPYYGLLKPDMTADVTIQVGKKRGVLVVPASAVKVGIDGKSYVMVKEKGKWVKRVVETGWESEGKVEIVKGLKEGEVVALW